MKKILSEEAVERVESKMDWEGFDYYLENYAADDFEGTPLMEPLLRYLDAKQEIEVLLREAGVDI